MRIRDSSGGTNTVLLTQVGGGAFGNSRLWLETATRREFEKFKNEEVDLPIVCYGGPDYWIEDMIEEFGGPKRTVKKPEPAPVYKMTFISSSSSSSDDDDDDGDDDEEEDKDTKEKK